MRASSASRNSRVRSTLGLACLVTTTALASASACGSDDDDHAVAADAAGGGADAGPVVPLDATLSGFTDGQIYQILLAFNEGEITEADTANGEASSAAVKELSGGFDETYTNVDAKLVQFARPVNLVPAPSDEATSLAAATTADEAIYQSLSGAAFDSAYLSAQINAHQALLNLIDTKLTPSVTSPDLGGLLGTERDQIATNLAAALAVQSGAGAGPEAGLDAGTDSGVDSGLDATVDAADAGDATDAALDALDASDDADADADAADGDDASDAADGD